MKRHRDEQGSPRAEVEGGPARKLDVIRLASEHRFPTGDIDQMLAEVERGYLDAQP